MFGYGGRVGQQVRHADSNARRRFNAEAERRALAPRSLSEAERGNDTVVTARGSVPVKVWVDFGNAAVQIIGIATAWTSRCVLVQWQSTGGETQEAWVWASACERLGPSNP